MPGLIERREMDVRGFTSWVENQMELRGVRSIRALCEAIGEDASLVGDLIDEEKKRGITLERMWVMADRFDVNLHELVTAMTGEAPPTMTDNEAVFLSIFRLVPEDQRWSLRAIAQSLVRRNKPERD